jgi:hypothetical protein
MRGPSAADRAGLAKLRATKSSAVEISPRSNRGSRIPEVGSMSASSATITLPVTLLAWRPVIKGGLRGFVTIQLGRSLKITDAAVLCSNRKLRASLP